MTKHPICIDVNSKISDVVDIMSEKELHRIPVISGKKLVGLVTEGMISKKGASKATSLSIYELNYLLSKTSVDAIMIRDVITIHEDRFLEDAALHEKYSGKKYDMVEANIVADIIIALTKQVPDYIKDGGIFLSSGIITERKEDVLAALAAGGFDVQDVREKKGWVAIASKYVG